jgi:hypothetical protein
LYPFIHWTLKCQVSLFQAGLFFLPPSLGFIA